MCEWLCVTMAARESVSVPSTHSEPTCRSDCGWLRVSEEGERGVLVNGWRVAEREVCRH